MLTDLLNRPCTITSRGASGTRDARGNEVPTVTSIETVCELQQRGSVSSGETTVNEEISSTDWLLILPAGTVIGHADTVHVAGDAYELVGEPWPARNPRTGSESHIEARVRRTASTQETGS